MKLSEETADSEAQEDKEYIMARSYAAVPHDYLEEMELLSDAEFGRLIRALLVYSRTGETSELSGSERVLFPRVKLQEDRFQESYYASLEQKKEAGRKSAEARANKKKRRSSETNARERCSTETDSTPVSEAAFNETEREATALNGVERNPTALNGVEQRSTEANETNNNKNKNNNNTPDAIASCVYNERQSRSRSRTSSGRTSQIAEIISYLNQKAGTRYKATTDSTRRHINARLEEGFTVDDFKVVIDKKVQEWLNDPGMSRFLRPETLFGTKFEGYLNARVRVKQSPSEEFLRIAQEEGCL